jgi:hypothetical protein
MKNKLAPLFVLSAITAAGSVAVASEDQPVAPNSNAKDANMITCQFNGGSMHINTAILNYKSGNGNARFRGFIFMPEGKEYNYKLHNVAKEAADLPEHARKMDIYVSITEGKDKKADDVSGSLTYVAIDENLKLQRNAVAVKVGFEGAGEAKLALCVVPKKEDKKEEAAPKP